jgi:hypothetical protein
MLLLIDIFSINKGRGYENPNLEIIVTERCSTGGFPLEEACEHCYLNQSVVLLLFRISFLCIVNIFYISGILHPPYSLSLRIDIQSYSRDTH